MKEELVIDLRVNSYEFLANAAARSNWIPPEYYANDWLPDCARWLEFGTDVDLASNPSNEQLMEFYQVKGIQALIDAQAEHIRKLQQTLQSKDKHILGKVALVRFA